MSELDVLLRRGQEFLKWAFRALEEGSPDVAAYLMSMGFTLILKYAASRVVGQEVSTNSMSDLIGILYDYAPPSSQEELAEVIRKYGKELRELEYAPRGLYYGSKYYTVEDAKKFRELVERVLGIVARTWPGLLQRSTT